MWSWWLVWIALAVAVLAPVAAATRTARAGLALWRQVRSTRGAVLGALDRLADVIDAALVHAEETSGGDELAPSLARLARSRRRLAVLRSAWDEVTDSVAAIRAFYPRK